MKIFYVNNQISKYKIGNSSYIVSLIAATFYLFISLFLVFMILYGLFPDTGQFFLNKSKNVNSKLAGILFAIIIPIFLSFLIKETDLDNSTFTKEYINKAINFYILYSILSVIIVGLIGLKFFPMK